MIPSVGMIVELAAKSKCGEQILRTCGDLWVITKLQRWVPFDSRTGEWAYLESGNGKHVWLLLNQDMHLTIRSAA